MAEATQTLIATAPVPTPTETVPVAIDATETGDETPTPGDDGNGEENGESDETPSDDGNGTQDCGFEENAVVIVTTDNLNLRTDPVIDADNVIDTLAQGSELRIIDSCYEEDAEGNQFWRVRDQETSRTGYVAGEFLALPDEE